MVATKAALWLASRLSSQGLQLSCSKIGRSEQSMQRARVEGDERTAYEGTRELPVTHLPTGTGLAWGATPAHNNKITTRLLGCNSRPNLPMCHCKSHTRISLSMQPKENKGQVISERQLSTRYNKYRTLRWTHTRPSQHLTRSITSNPLDPQLGPDLAPTSPPQPLPPSPSQKRQPCSSP